MFKQIVLGLFIAGAGAVLMFFSQQIADAFGRSARAEANLGSTRNLYILIAFGMVVVGFLFVFGVIPVTSPVDAAAGV